MKLPGANPRYETLSGWRARAKLCERLRAISKNVSRGMTPENEPPPCGALAILEALKAERIPEPEDA